MKDNFNMHEWLLNEKIKGLDGKPCWKGYRYAGTENGKDKCVPIKETMDDDLEDIISDMLKYMSKEEILQYLKQMLANNLNENEATFTSKHDDNPKLKGGQKDLPDEVQAKIVAKENEDHEVSMAQASLKSIISNASQLMNKLGNDERNIPGWIQDHIVNAENYIDQANQGFHELDNEYEED
jgi:hypothetical protein